MQKLNHFVSISLFSLTAVLASGNSLPALASWNSANPASSPKQLTEIGDTLKASKVRAEAGRRAGLEGPVEKMNSDEIRRLGYADSGEALRNFSGISIKDYGGVGGLRTVSVRGFGAQHTNVIIDGLQVSDLQSGAADLGSNNFVKPYNIKVSIAENEDIFKSAGQMVAVGSVEMTSEDNLARNKAFSLGAMLRYGSFNTIAGQVFYDQDLTSKRSNASASGGLFDESKSNFGESKTNFGESKTNFDESITNSDDGKVNSGEQMTSSGESSPRRVTLTAGIDFVKSDGDYPYTIDGDTLTHRRAGSAAWRLSPELGLKARLGAGALKAKVLADFAERGLPGAAILHNISLPTQQLSENRCAALVSYTGNDLGRWRVRSTLSWDYRHSHWSDSSAVYLTPAQEDYRQHQVLSSSIVMFDVGHGFKLSLAEDLGAGHLATTLPDCPFPTRISSLTALSGNYRGGPFSVTTTIAGSVIKDFVQSGDEVPVKLHLSPSVSAGVRLPSGFSLHASLRDGYRAPSFNDLYWTRVGTRNLRSEKAFQSNLGMNWSISSSDTNSGTKSSMKSGTKSGTNSATDSEFSLYLSADGYCNLVRDKIVASPSLFIWSMHNIGEALMAGCDLNFGGHWRPFSSQKGICLYFHAAYSYQYAIDISDSSASNYRDQIRYIPRHSGNGSLSIDTPWLRLSYNVIAVGRRWFQDQNTPRSQMAPYADHSISLGKAFHIGKAEGGCGIDLSFDMLNIGNKNYEIIRSYPMPGRQFRGTIRITI